MSAIISLLNRLLEADNVAMQRLVEQIVPANDALLAKLPLTLYRRHRDHNVINFLTIINVDRYEADEIIVPVYHYPSRKLVSFKAYDLYDGNECLADPRPPREIMATIPGGGPEYTPHPPQIGERVVAMQIHADEIRTMCHDAWIQICAEQTRNGVLLSLEDELAFVQFGEAAGAAPIPIQFLHSHEEDRKKRNEQSESESEAVGPADQEADETGVQEVLPGEVGGATVAEGPQEG